MSVILVSAPRVIDDSGNPVAGALFESATGRICPSDSTGTFASDPEGEGTVRALGYEPWSGTVGPSTTVVLRRAPLQSGVLVEVRAAAPGPAEGSLSSSEIGSGHISSLEGTGIHSIGARVPGLVLREYGGPASVLSISVRGSDPSQVSWTVDGHRLRSAMDGGIPFLLDPDLFAGMRFARGGSSGFREGGLAGTVDLMPASPSTPPGLRLRADSRGGGGAVTGFTLGGICRFTLAASALRGPQDASGRSLSLLSTIHPPGGARLGLLVCSSRGGSESPDWSPPTDASIDRGSIDAWIATGAGGVTLRAGAHAGSVYYRGTTPTPVDDRNTDLSSEASVSLAAPAGPAALLFEADAMTEGVSGTSLGGRVRSTAGTGISAAVPAGPLSLDATGRLEACTGEGPGLGARASARLLLADGLVMTGISAARSFRRPTFNDLYWPADPFAEGNPGLDTETSAEIELVLAVEAGSFSADVALYTARVEDMIAWAPGAGGIWTPGNILEASKRGIEASAAAGAGHLSLAATFSLSRTVDESPGSVNEGGQLPYRPMSTWGVDAALDMAPFDAHLVVTGTGRRFINASNTLSLEGYALLGAGLRWRPTDATGLALTASNILDEEYEESNGFPGRGATFGVEVQLGAGEEI